MSGIAITKRGHDLLIDTVGGTGLLSASVMEYTYGEAYNCFTGNEGWEDLWYPGALVRPSYAELQWQYSDGLMSANGTDTPVRTGVVMANADGKLDTIGDHGTLFLDGIGDMEEDPVVDIWVPNTAFFFPIKAEVWVSTNGGLVSLAKLGSDLAETGAEHTVGITIRKEGSKFVLDTVGASLNEETTLSTFLLTSLSYDEKQIPGPGGPVQAAGIKMVGIKVSLTLHRGLVIDVGMTEQIKTKTHWAYYDWIK